LPFPWYGSERARRFNGWFVRTQVHLVARALGIITEGRTAPVVSITIPTALGAAQALPHSALVVNRSDKYSMFREANQEAIRAMEVRALEQADRVFYCARTLMEDEADLVGDRALALDHGVDVELFRPLPPEAVPADLAAIPGPRIGFFGKLRDRLVDYELLARVARAIPEASIVLIGPAEDSFDALAALPNVHYLGPRPYGDIPAYGCGFDVAVMPWRDNEWIRNANPIKLKEYLALGLPVVSTDFPEVRRYDDVIWVESDPESFIAAVKATLADGGLATPKARRAAVVESTWDRAARRFLHESERSVPVSPTVAPAASGFAVEGAILDRRSQASRGHGLAGAGDA
jgi:glycosyltransferase involved in cell wall biosynthesis